MPDYSQTFYRYYDSALGRFIAVDPKAESAESMTGYQFGGNNPLAYNDPMGDLLRLGDSNYSIPSHRIGPGSGNYWSDGITYPDWIPGGGSNMYRALLGTGGVAQSSDGSFYTMLSDKTKKPVEISRYGFYTYNSTIGAKEGNNTSWNNLFSVGINGTWHEVSTVSANQGGAQPGFLESNWKDIAFMGNDLTQAYIAGSTTLKASAGYRLAQTTVQLPLWLATRTSTRA